MAPHRTRKRPSRAAAATLPRTLPTRRVRAHGVALGQEEHDGGGDEDPEEREEPEDHRPRAEVEQPAAEERSNRRSDAEDHGDDAHELLGPGTVVEITHDRPRDDGARTCRGALEGPAEEQDGQREGGPDGGEGVDDRSADHDRLASHRVAQRAVEEAHRGEGEQVDADDLLQRGAADAEVAAHLGEGGEGVSIDSGPNMPSTARTTTMTATGALEAAWARRRGPEVVTSGPPASGWPLSAPRPRRCAAPAPAPARWPRGCDRRGAPPRARPG